MKEGKSNKLEDEMTRLSLQPRTRNCSSGSGGSEGASDDSNKSDPEERSGDPATHTNPGEFIVKYLGKKEARGLWGIKHTRKPVDELVATARGLQPGTPLPYLKLFVSERGVTLSGHSRNLNNNFEAGLYPIDTISYGVQDLVYTRVFAMIVVKDASDPRDAASVRRQPFECHAFVCESRHSARKLTFALANAFQIFSRSVKSSQRRRGKNFAIDLRSPEEIERDLENQLDSEA